MSSFSWKRKGSEELSVGCGLRRASAEKWMPRAVRRSDISGHAMDLEDSGGGATGGCRHVYPRSENPDLGYTWGCEILIGDPPFICGEAE